MIYAGIDEAGYGPLLGPLCVGASAFALPCDDPMSRPDLWKLLDSGVCRAAKDARRRVAVADSKKLKGVGGAGVHPLRHLERGVLAFAGGDVPSSDTDLFTRLGAAAHRSRATPWHDAALPAPVALTAAEAAIARNMVARALERAGMSTEHLAVSALDAPAFNALYGTLRNKASVNMSLVFDALRTIDHLRGAGTALVAIDRQGGRAAYTDALEAHVAHGARVRVIEETDERSSYEIGDGLFVTFEIEAETAHLPVALASMAAKLVRELFMRRLNRFFTERVPGLEPTAGYVTDGRRYLAEVKPLLAAEGIPEAEFTRVV
ncbi:MAG: hypothetical protein LW636_08805 [Planctomycetaceae bacterium]|nr:hypothetical protein [Planctomycetaceae bacterium]